MIEKNVKYYQPIRKVKFGLNRPIIRITPKYKNGKRICARCEKELPDGVAFIYCWNNACANRNKKRDEKNMAKWVNEHYA